VFVRRACVVAAVLVVTAPAAANASCGSSGYAYAGVAGSTPAYGIATRLQATATPQVMSGHVAGWVGVGGPGAGPNGADEWIQVGFSAFPGSSLSSLYYEVAQPNQAPRYYELAAALPPGATKKVTVMEVPGRNGWWRVLVDDHAVGAPVFLPGSHGAWRPVATSEAWGAGSAVCNRFRYRFASVSVATSPGGSWRPLRRLYTFQDHGYRIKRIADATFLAGIF
jgi:hypothetical protein